MSSVGLAALLTAGATLGVGAKVSAAAELAYPVVDCTKPGDQFIIADGGAPSLRAETLDDSGKVNGTLERQVSSGSGFYYHFFFTAPPGTDYSAVRFTNEEGETQTVEPVVESCTSTAVNATTGDPGPGLVSVQPQRLLDTRTWLSKDPSGASVVGGNVVEVAVLGKGGIPEDAAAVLLNVAAVQPQSVGHLRVFPCGTRLPLTSNVNFVAGETRAANVFVKPGANGKVCIYTSSRTELLADSQGFVPNGSQPFAIRPVRAADTRPGAPFDGPGLLPAEKANGVVRLDMAKLAGVSGIPANAQNFVINITATNATSRGFVTVDRCGPTLFGGTPLRSTVNFAPGRAAANMAFTATRGELCLLTSGPVDLIVDVAGYSTSVFASPRAHGNAMRLLDTRPARKDQGGTVDGNYSGDGRLQAGVEYKVDIARREAFPGFFIPYGTAVVLNVTAIRPDANGYITVYECGKRPSTSNLNVREGDTVANAALVHLDAGGAVCVYSSVATDLVLDAPAYEMPRDAPVLWNSTIDLTQAKPSANLPVVNGAPPYRVTGTVPAPVEITVDDNGVISYTGARDSYTYYNGTVTITDATGAKLKLGVVIGWYPPGADVEPIIVVD